MTSDFEHIHILQISIHSAELVFTHAQMGQALVIHGGLVNIARGSCQLTVTPVDILPKHSCGTLFIEADRPVMRAEISLQHEDFLALSSALSRPSPRPATMMASLPEPLCVSTEGFLFIEHDSELEIAELKSLVPLR